MQEEKDQFNSHKVLIIRASSEVDFHTILLVGNLIKLKREVLKWFTIYHNLVLVQLKVKGPIKISPQLFSKLDKAKIQVL